MSFAACFACPATKSKRKTASIKRKWASGGRGEVPDTSCEHEDSEWKRTVGSGVASGSMKQTDSATPSSHGNVRAAYRDFVSKAQ